MVHQGNAWGIFHFGPTFSIDMLARYLEHNTSAAVIAGSQVYLALDSSNQQIAYTIQQKTVGELSKIQSILLDNYFD